MPSRIDSLFSEIGDDARREVAPLAVRMRPQSLDELVGQKEAVGTGTWLREAIEGDRLSSIVLFGPAGTGKTSLARIIASSTQAAFVEVSAVSGTVADLRREIDAADSRLAMTSQRTILFIDEIHRFSRSQQDALLHAVEDRIVVMIGATTENPFFEVNSALLSRSRVVELKPLDGEDIKEIVTRALSDERGLAGRYLLSDAALDAIAVTAGGDARMALTTLELASALAVDAHSAPAGELDASQRRSGKPAILVSCVREASPTRQIPYDKKADMHYDCISAFIKSMRGSDPDAAIYWLARMIEGGEDPKFIARRIFIFAAEDISNADPQAILVGEAAFRAAEVIGYPECQINLAQATVYMALAPKSNAAYSALIAAQRDIRTAPVREVPSYLRDRHRPGSENYGDYKYPHSYPGGWVDQRYLPEGLDRGCFYQPSPRGWEAYRTDAVAGDRAGAIAPCRGEGGAKPRREAAGGASSNKGRGAGDGMGRGAGDGMGRGAGASDAADPGSDAEE